MRRLGAVLAGGLSSTVRTWSTDKGHVASLQWSIDARSAWVVTSGDSALGDAFPTPDEAMSDVLARVRRFISNELKTYRKLYDQSRGDGCAETVAARLVGLRRAENRFREMEAGL